jgi:hypothetical protein
MLPDQLGQEFLGLRTTNAPQAKRGVLHGVHSRVSVLVADSLIGRTDQGANCLVPVRHDSWHYCGEKLGMVSKPKAIDAVVQCVRFRLVIRDQHYDDHQKRTLNHQGRPESRTALADKTNDICDNPNHQIDNPRESDDKARQEQTTPREERQTNISDRSEKGKNGKRFASNHTRRIA